MIKFSTDKGTSFSKNPSLNCGNKILTLDKPKIMGVLNVTPDSFYDGNRYDNQKAILKQTEKMISAGAAIIDVGAMSTRPGAEEIKTGEEISRLKPVLEQVSKLFPETIISVDTYRSEVARFALESGGHIINDISGGAFDPAMIKLVVQRKAPYIIMHIQGSPRNMQVNPTYTNVVKDVKGFLNGQINKLTTSGYNQIIVDPGFGFGKTLGNNYSLLKHLREIKSLGYPVLVGISRKSMINKVLNISPKDALNGTTILNTLALINGADILRVHDVMEAREAISLVEAYLNSP